MILRKNKKTEHKPQVKDQNNKAYDIPLEGSLGILASGYKGIMMWRHKRQDHAQTLKQQPKGSK